MKSPASPRFAAVFQTEVLYNLKRVAPYALMVLFSGNALLWWGWGPAVMRGWAVNSDFYIVRLFGGFSFMTLPLFIALLMGDPVVRDFRVHVDPLIFSKPIGRAEYLLGKFFGNFFVLVCCQACFALTLVLLQAFSTSGMIVQQARLLPYLQHFFFFVVVSSLVLASVYFAVGTLTRNVKLVYGLAVSFYFVYIAWHVSIKGLPMRWRVLLDPLLFMVGAEVYKDRTAEWLNQLTVTYDVYMVANRLLMLAVSALCMAVIYFRFSIAERAGKDVGKFGTSILDLAPKAERLYVGPTSPTSPTDAGPATDYQEEEAAAKHVSIPRVGLVNEGWRAGLSKFAAALGAEFRLLRAERSLVVIAPLVALMCGLQVWVYGVTPEPSYSAAYAAATADALLLFLFGVAVFYTGESMHRDRELGVEPVLWATPAPNSALVLSKFAATLVLSLSLVALAGLTAAAVQLCKGHAPLDVWVYVKTCALITVPSAVFMVAASVALNVILRDKYLTYAVSLALGGMLYYLAGQGYNHPLYNPALYGLWTPADLARGGRLTLILTQRVYCIALSSMLLSLALLLFGRKTAGGSRSRGRLNVEGRTILAASASALAALVTGIMVSAGW